MKLKNGVENEQKAGILSESKNQSFFDNDAHIFIDETTSTNQVATRLIESGHTKEGTIVIAHHQTQGRGQRGKSWYSSPGKNILASLILKPHFLELQHQFDLSIAIALGICDWVSQYIDSAVHVKWPNDIYVKDRKIAGILIQNMLAGKIIQHSIIGIGINVNEENFAKDLPNPTSLYLESQKKYILDDLYAVLFSTILDRYEQLKKGEAKNLKKEYLQKMYLRGVFAPFSTSDQEFFIGKIKGIDDMGRLVITTKNGRNMTFDTSAISYL